MQTAKQPTRSGARRALIAAVIQSLTLATVSLAAAVSIADTAVAMPTGVVYPTSWTGTGDTRVGTAGGVTVTATAGGGPSSIFRVGDMQMAVLGLPLPSYMPTDADAAIAWGTTGCFGSGEADCGSATYTFDKPVTNLTMWVSDIGAVEYSPLVTSSHASPITISGGGTFSVDGTSVNAKIVPASGSGSVVSHVDTLSNIGQLFIDNGPTKNNSSCGIFYGCGVYQINTAQTVYTSITFNFGHIGSGTNTDAFPIILGYTPVATGISLTKTATASGTSAGATITYGFEVNNTGNVPLDPVTVTDPTLGPVTCPSGPLAAGASLTCTPVAYTLTQSDVDVGGVSNTATAHGTPPTGDEVTDSDSVDVPITADPEITLDKQHTAPARIAVGAVVPYRFTVGNNGNVTLGSIAVNDAKTGIVACPVTTLAPGASTTCTASHTIDQADIRAGTINNTATAEGTPPVGAKVTATDTDSLALPLAAITVDKHVEGGPITQVGARLAYTFVVTNTGNLSLTDITVADAMLSGVACPRDTLGLDESMTCTADPYTVTSSDALAGRIINTATVSALACTYTGGPGLDPCTPIAGVSAQAEGSNTVQVGTLALTGAGLTGLIGLAGLALLGAGLLVRVRGRRRNRET